MAEIQLQRIKSLYGEIAGLLSQIPLADKSRWVPKVVGDQYNGAVDELMRLCDSDYTRLKLTENDTSDYSGEDDDFDTISIRTKVGSLVKRLEEEYGFGAASMRPNSQPVIVTVNQNQEVTLSVTPLQQIIDSTEEESIRRELEELKKVLATKNQEKASGILNRIQQRSWEVFITVLPFVLEQLGKRQG